MMGMWMAKTLAVLPITLLTKMTFKHLLLSLGNLTAWISKGFQSLSGKSYRVYSII